jgi:hypothetical protein
MVGFLRDHFAVTGVVSRGKDIRVRLWRQNNAARREYSSQAFGAYKCYVIFVIDHISALSRFGFDFLTLFLHVQETN